MLSKRASVAFGGVLGVGRQIDIQKMYGRLEEHRSAAMSSCNPRREPIYDFPSKNNFLFFGDFLLCVCTDKTFHHVPTKFLHTLVSIALLDLESVKACTVYNASIPCFVVLHVVFGLLHGRHAVAIQIVFHYCFCSL